MQINIFSQVINHWPKAGWTRQAKVITWAHESKIHLISFLIQWMNRAKAIQLSESKFRQVTVIVVWGLPVGTLYLASRFLIRTYHCNLIILCLLSQLSGEKSSLPSVQSYLVSQNSQPLDAKASSSLSFTSLATSPWSLSSSSTSSSCPHCSHSYLWKNLLATSNGLIRVQMVVAVKLEMCPFFFVFKILSHRYDFFYFDKILDFFICVRNFTSSNYKYLLLCDWWQHILQVWPVGCPKVHLDHRQDDHTYHHNHLHHYQPHHHHHHQICYMHLGRLRDECIGNACHPLQRRTRTIVLHFRRLQILRWRWYHFIISS